MSSRHSLAFQVWGSLVIGAFLIAYLASGTSLPRFAAIFAISLLFLVFLFFAVVRLFVRWKKSGELNGEVERRLADARSLSLPEAEERALALLLDIDKFQILEKPVPADSLRSLGTELQRFFSRFETVKEVKGDTSLDRSHIGISTLRDGFLRIGTDMEHTEIVVRPDNDTIYVIDGTEAEDPVAEEGFPTIYHFLVAGYNNQPHSGGKEDV